MNVLLFVTVITGLLAVPVSALRRARRDWPYELRLMLALDYLDRHDAPQAGLALSEVRLAPLVEPSMFDEFVPVHARQFGGRLVLLHLDEPLGERAEMCVRWCEAATPLLLVTDDYHGAVLNGPDGQLLGQLVQHGFAGPDRIETVEQR